jgi:hypothetical protein
METPFQLAQDESFITRIRNLTTQIIPLIDITADILAEKNVMFGASGRLTSDAFINQNVGLVKSDIMTALDVLVGLKTYLDTGSNRGYLETVRNPQ